MKAANDAQDISPPYGSTRARDPQRGERRLRRPPGTGAPRQVRVTAWIDAAPNRVFDAWLDAEFVGEWLFATASRPMTRVEIDPRVGGSFCFAEGRGDRMTEYRGRYFEIVPPRRLAFDLWVSGVPTRVIVDIAALKRGTSVKLTHERVPREHATYLEQRWTGILYGLGVTLAGQRIPCEQGNTP